jgi:hypothetical protein
MMADDEQVDPSVTGNPLAPAGALDFADLFGAGPPTAAPEQREVIGGYRGPRAETRYPDHLSRPGSPAYTQPRTYYAGDARPILREELTLEDRVRLQQEMVALGLITGDPVYGELDDGTVRAFDHVLSMANAKGEDWRSTLGRIATEGLNTEGSAAGGFTPEPYLAPDYATLSQRIKQTFRDQLGRDPDGYELQQLAGELSGYDALAHEREQEYAQLAATGGGSMEGATSVDPLARFNERFESLYAGELDLIEDKQQAVDTRSQVQSAVDVLSTTSRGG